MELSDALRRRRMVRRFDPDTPVDADTLETVVGAALRAPSAGFTQGVSLLVLTAEDDRHRFWAATAGPRGVDDRGSPGGSGAGRGGTGWLDGMTTAPVLVLVWTSEEAYLDRYAAPDKGWTDRDPGRWSAPYWFVDAGMAAMAMLLAAVDAELGACFFGVPADRQTAVRTGFGVPAAQHSVGVVALGRPAEDRRSGSSLRRPRKPVEAMVHRGRWDA